MRVELPAVSVPDETAWQPTFGAYFHTGRNAGDAVWFKLDPGTDVAIDIETPSITDSFTIKCVTAAWVQGTDTHVVLLDPTRNKADWFAVRTLADRARWLILHNAPFDMPGLAADGLITIDQVAKVMDTLVYARAAWSDPLTPKSLEALASRVLGLSQLKGALKLAQKASGLTSNEKWFTHGDIHMPAYRAGAMTDTLVTLRLAYPLFELAVNRQLDHPFSHYGCTTREEAAELVSRQQRVNQIMLRRAAVIGYEVDLDYLDKYVDSVHAERARAEIVLRDEGVRPGVAQDVIKKLVADNALPANWPRTKPTKTFPEGNLKADKDTMELLPAGHPLAGAHRIMTDTKRILGYMEKTVARSRPTGRLHPQFNILGASASGRMSVSSPELQQFPALARPIIRHDQGSAGVHSVDWTSIEPALMGWLAHDWDFIDPYEAGDDIYASIVRMAGIPRKPAKVVLLADMYGRGISSTGVQLSVSDDEVKELKRRMHAAMPLTARYMRKVKRVAEDTGLAITISGRVLTLPRKDGQFMGYKAVNYGPGQGSCYDFLAWALVRLDDLGIADKVMIPMHDEIVCATEIAEEVQRVMQTPPPEMAKWTGGRVPVVRTDSEFLGDCWSKPD